MLSKTSKLKPNLWQPTVTMAWNNIKCNLSQPYLRNLLNILGSRRARVRKFVAPVIHCNNLVRQYSHSRKSYKKNWYEPLGNAENCLAAFVSLRPCVFYIAEENDRHSSQVNIKDKIRNISGPLSYVYVFTIIDYVRETYGLNKYLINKFYGKIQSYVNDFLVSLDGNIVLPGSVFPNEIHLKKS